MPIDRAATLRNAEKLLRTGKLEAAIAEYLRVVEDQPRDWNTANVLGDLYVRAGKTDKAVEQFARIADSLSQDGFLPKAAALYKKILKIRPDDEHALLQGAEIAAQQGVLVDARSYLNIVAESRLARGDRKGVAEIRVRIGALDPSDFDARRAGARARVEAGDSAGALRDLKVIAADLVEKGRQVDAIAVLREAAELDKSDEDVRSQLFASYLADGDLERAHEYATTPRHFHGLGRAHVDRGDLVSAARFLNVDTAADDPEVLLKIAEVKIRTGALDEGLDIVRQVIDKDPAHAGAVTLLGCDIAQSMPDAGFAVVDIAAETAVKKGDWPSAAGALQEFVTRVPHHISALMRLVEIYFDGHLESALYSAQSQLADAYLATGAASEARVIAEDLIGREPSEPLHVEQLRRALVLLGEENPDRIIAERLNAAPEDVSVDDAASAELGYEPGPSDSIALVNEPAPADSIAMVDEPAPPDFIELVDEPAPADSIAMVGESAPPDFIELVDEPTPADFIARAGPPALAAKKADKASPDLEIDLSDVLADFGAAAAPSREGPGVRARPPAEQEDEQEPEQEPEQEQDQDQDQDQGGVFELFRAEASHGSKDDAARAAYDRAVALRDAGLFDESIPAFEAASREPRLRFHAAAELGRLYRRRNLLDQAIEWFEQAAQAPAPTSDEAHSLFLELAETLESRGEVKRALAICLELQAEAGNYRDVAARIKRLAKVRTRG